MKAYLNGIPLHIIDPKESCSWEVKTTNFITQHPPTVKRMGKNPARLCVSALLVGKSALLLKDIIIRTLESEKPAKLIHPLFGIKQVLCSSYNIEAFSNSSNAFSLELDFLEQLDPPAKNALSSIKDMVDDASNVVQNLAIEFFKQMEMLQELNYNVQTFSSLILQVKHALTTRGGIGSVTETINEMTDATINVLSIGMDPKKIFSDMSKAVFSFSRVHKKTELSLSSIFAIKTQDNKFKFVQDTAVILALYANEGPLDETDKQHIESMLDRAGSGVISDDVFVYLWDRLLNNKTKRTEFIARKRKVPSLVASYRDFNTLEKAEELAYGTGQPFSV